MTHIKGFGNVVLPARDLGGDGNLLGLSQAVAMDWGPAPGGE